MQYVSKVTKRITYSDIVYETYIDGVSDTNEITLIGKITERTARARVREYLIEGGHFNKKNDGISIISISYRTEKYEMAFDDFISYAQEVE